MYCHKGDPFQFMLDALNGKDSLKVNYDTTIGVVLAIPDFPYGNFEEEQVCGLPIYGITEENEPNVQPQSMAMGKLIDEEMDEVLGPVTAGDYVAIVVDTGKTVEEAQENVYEIVKEIAIPNKIFRNDIGNRVIKALPDLQKLGYASDWTLNNGNKEE